MGKQTKITHGLLWLIMITSLPLGVSAGDSPPCMAYAYTLDEQNHYSLIATDSFVFGTRISVESNCPNTQLIIDGELMAYGNNTITGYTSAGFHNVTITNQNFTANYSNVNFIQSGGLNNVINNMPANYNPYSEPYTPQQINNLELVSGIGAILLSWVIVVGVMWKLISSYQERNFVEEVV